MELSTAEKLVLQPKEIYTGEEAVALIDYYLSDNISAGRLAEIFNIFSGDLNLLASAKFAFDNINKIRSILTPPPAGE
jgi:hypothetical protein